MLILVVLISVFLVSGCFIYLFECDCVHFRLSCSGFSLIFVSVTRWVGRLDCMCSFCPLFIPRLGHCSLVVNVVMGCIVVVVPPVKIASAGMLFLIRVSLFLDHCCFDAICFHSGCMVRVFGCQLFCILVGGIFVACHYFAGMLGERDLVGFV